MYICLYIEICGGIRWRMMGYTETVWNMLEHNTMGVSEMRYAPQIALFIGTSLMIIDQWIYGFLIFRQTHIIIQLILDIIDALWQIITVCYGNHHSK